MFKMFITNKHLGWCYLQMSGDPQEGSGLYQEVASSQHVGGKERSYTDVTQIYFFPLIEFFAKNVHCNSILVCFLDQGNT